MRHLVPGLLVAGSLCSTMGTASAAELADFEQDQRHVRFDIGFLSEDQGAIIGQPREGMAGSAGVTWYAQGLNFETSHPWAETQFLQRVTSVSFETTYRDRSLSWYIDEDNNYQEVAVDGIEFYGNAHLAFDGTALWGDLTVGGGDLDITPTSFVAYEFTDIDGELGWYLSPGFSVSALIKSDIITVNQRDTESLHYGGAFKLLRSTSYAEWINIEGAVWGGETETPDWTYANIHVWAEVGMYFEGRAGTSVSAALHDSENGDLDQLIFGYTLEGFVNRWLNLVFNAEYIANRAEMITDGWNASLTAQLFF